jgi:hypothetical protein
MFKTRDQNRVFTLNRKDPTLMTVKCPPQSAFFNPRALIGLGLGATSLFLATLGFFTFPSTAKATPQCSPVEFTENWTGYQQVKIQMSSDPGCTIYYTVRVWNYPPDPTHSSAVYNPTGNPNYQGLGISPGTINYYKALAYNPNATPVDSAISSYSVDNTGN